MDRQADGQTDRWVHGWMDVGWLDAQMDDQTGRWMDGWMVVLNKNLHRHDDAMIEAM